MGEIDNSVDSYKNTILQNNLSGEAFWSLANLKTYSFSENEIIAVSYTHLRAHET